MGKVSDGFNWDYQTCTFDKPQNVWHLEAGYDPVEWGDNRFGSGGLASISIMKGDSLDDMSVKDGGYNIDMSVFRRGIRLGTNAIYEVPIILVDTRESIGFDYATKSLYFQRVDGTRIMLAK